MVQSGKVESINYELYSQMIILKNHPNAFLHHLFIIQMYILLELFVYLLSMRIRIGNLQLQSSNFYWEFKIYWLNQIHYHLHRMRLFACFKKIDLHMKKECENKLLLIVQSFKINLFLTHVVWTCLHSYKSCSLLE